MLKINLRKLLTDKRMNQSELAALTEIRLSTICDICNNNCLSLKIDNDNIDKICEVLGCDVQALISFFPQSKG